LGGGKVEGTEGEIVAIKTADGKHASNDENLQSVTAEYVRYHDEQKQRVRDKGIDPEHSSEDSTIISIPCQICKWY
jgi:hypothetical protein